MRWDPEKFAFVPGSVRSTASAAVLFDLLEADWLQVDLAWLGRTQSGERGLFSFQLAPLEVATPGLVLATEFAVSGAQQFTFASSSAGTRIPVPQPAQPAPAAAAETEAAAAGKADAAGAEDAGPAVEPGGTTAEPGEESP
jgi:hypothetical protein